MKFSYSIPVDRSADTAWEALRDTERVIRCLPGCEGVEPAGAGASGTVREEGVEIYRVRVATGLGPIRLRAAGTARVRRDSAGRSVTADVSLSDPRAGSMYGTMALQVRAVDADRSEIRLEADIALASKMGEFAQPILRHKADQTVREFARNLIGTL